MKNYSIEEIYKMDQLLYSLASYEATKGLLIIPKDISDITNIHVKTAEKFNEFKLLIQRGTCDIEFIKNTVLAKNGPVPRLNCDGGSDEFINNLLTEAEETEKENSYKEETEKIADTYLGLLNNLINIMEKNQKKYEMPNTEKENKGTENNEIEGENKNEDPPSGIEP